MRLAANPEALRDEQAWKPTGLWRFRPRGLFGRYAALQVHEARDVFDPIYIGHTSANWRSQQRWRWATFGEALTHGTRDQWGRE